ncbi:NADP-dependent oxidoreductase [Vibrio sonorensis]|uniref:NADP-dependent oxidoreductase n=1 Tax=Vibrio sonorensis TaxID=1004316 RepID=UPI0008D9FB00|nr:NADP-dependent oxidoreductase [Vibrio sonorensis]
MKAAFIKEYGDSSQLVVGELAKPTIQPHQVLIKVVASAINPVDFHVRNGMAKDSGIHTLPLVLGWDVSGVVEQVGSEVEGLQKGDSVLAFTPVSEQGTNAEYVATSSELVIKKPKDMSFIEAAGLPLASVTAYQAIEQMEVSSGDTMLIHNASGAVGAFAVQIAKALGVRVIATASKPKHELVKGWGADLVYAYEDKSWQVNQSVDATLVAIGNDEIIKQSLVATKGGGWVISTLNELPEGEATKHAINFERMWVSNSKEQLEKVVELYNRKQLIVPIDTVLPLDLVKYAHQRSEQYLAVGKIVLSIDPLRKF